MPLGANGKGSKISLGGGSSTLANTSIFFGTLVSKFGQLMRGVRCSLILFLFILWFTLLIIFYLYIYLILFDLFIVISFEYIKITKLPYFSKLFPAQPSQLWLLVLKLIMVIFS